MEKNKLKRLFDHYAPNEDQVERMGNIQKLGHALAELINETTPDSPEQTKAIRSVENAVMWANKCIVVNDPKPQPLGGPVGGDEPDDPPE